MRMRELAIVASLGYLSWTGAVEGQDTAEQVADPAPLQAEPAPPTGEPAAEGASPPAESGEAQAPTEPAAEPTPAAASELTPPPPPSSAPAGPPIAPPTPIAPSAEVDPSTAPPSTTALGPMVDAGDEEQKQKEAEHSPERDPMNTLGIGVKTGFLIPMAFARTDRRIGVKYDAEPMAMGVGLGRSVPVADTLQSSRGADVLYALALPINLGDGHGVALDLEPTIAFCVSCDETRGDYTWLGVYGGLAVRFQPADPFYMSIGAGLRPGIALLDATKIATQGELRVPVTLTYYVHESVGIVFEIALGYGGYFDLFDDERAEAAVIRNHAVGTAEGRTLTGGIPYANATPVVDGGDAAEFAFGASLDFMLGVRFP
jgi:hypothetical protein